MSIGNRIRVARKAIGLSQQELARYSGLSLQGVAKIEQGGVDDPHWSTLKAIATGLGTTVGELLEGKQPSS